MPEHILNDSGQLVFAFIGKHPVERLNDANGLRVVNVGEQQGDDVFTDAAPIIRAGAGSFRDASRIERNGDLIRLILRAFTLCSQLQALSQRFNKRAVLVITQPALKTLRASKSAN